MSTKKIVTFQENSKKTSIILQGNKPTDDPKKFGLKFDGGKARWDLIPFKELDEIIQIPAKYIENNEFSCLTEYNEIDLFNEIMNLISLNDRHCSGYKNIFHIRDFALIGFNMFFLLRGKAYTMEELNASCNICRWDLFDINEIQKIVDVYSYGAKLYSPDNWKNVTKERYFSALIRHFKTVRTKERFDSESGFLHLHHAIWNVLALMWLENNKK